jgi:hypothetical protein
MLHNINDDPKKINILIEDICGNAFTILQRILNRNFGSNKYELIKVSSNIHKIYLENYSDSVYMNFDLRLKGIVFYFRYKNTEYVEFCNYNMLTLQSSDFSFVLQTDRNIYNFKILNKKNHNKFIKKLYKLKNNFKK